MQARLPALRRRNQLLAVALERFAHGGFHTTAMSDIAEAAGVTKPVLYQHFSSKRGLYLELLEHVGATLLAAISEATAAVAPEGPRRQVEAGFDAYLRLVRERPEAFRLLFGGGARRDEEFAEAVHSVERRIASTISSLIEADIDDDQRTVLGHAIVGMAEGAIRQHLTSDRPIGDEAAARLARQLADLAWGGLRGVRRV